MSYLTFVMALILVGAGHIGVIIGQGWGAYADMMSPFNVANYIMTVIAFIPAMLFHRLSVKLGEKDILNS